MWGTITQHPNEFSRPPPLLKYPFFATYVYNIRVAMDALKFINKK